MKIEILGLTIINEIKQRISIESVLLLGGILGVAVLRPLGLDDEALATVTAAEDLVVPVLADSGWAGDLRHHGDLVVGVSVLLSSQDGPDRMRSHPTQFTPSAGRAGARLG